ncbi:hypothetical protein BH24ACI5_BH24ACI5_10830 [soil metagenome]
MTLPAGARLGPYAIVGPLGQGGMGVVYKARDTRLDRTVAIKVITSDATGTPEARARFEREARTISRLDHPNICTLHDVGREGATDYLVLEYLDGETLAARLARGALPPRDAVTVATQIAAALARAHQAGIVHRDLKPGNVMLTRRRENGAGSLHVKLLDFGLAGLVQGESASPREAGIETISAPLTLRGTILGTLHYMSPEQVEAQPADTRADIWAFGCVLYEMLAGGRPFDAPTDAGVIAAILERQPVPLSHLKPETPRALKRLVEACLAKNPDERVQSARDLLLVLRWAADEQGVPLPAPRAPSNRVGALAAVGLLCLALGAAAATLWGPRGTAPAPAGAIQAAIPLPRGGAFALFGSNIALSPDGRLIVYTEYEGTTSRLVARTVDEMEPRPIRGTEGGETPFFSPDGRHIGFQAVGRLRQVPIDGETPRDIVVVSGARGAAWAPDDTIVYTPSFNAGLWKVKANGDSPPEPFTTLDESRDERTHRYPEILPDGRTVLFMVGDTQITAYNEARIVARSLDGGETRLVLEGGLSPRYLASGHLVYNTGSTLVAAPFDPARLALTGPPRVVAENVAWSPGFGTTHYAVGGEGHLIYIPGGETFGRTQLTWLHRSGARTTLDDRLSHFLGARLSPDGTRLLLLDHAANDHLKILDIPRQALSRLTFRGSANFAAWTPDSGHIIYIIGNTISRVRSDGGGAVEELYSDETQKIFVDVSPEGAQVVFNSHRERTGADIMVLHLADGTVKSWLATPFTESQPRFSPDGRWIAYVSNESGRFEVFVSSREPGGAKLQISTHGGSSPAWARSGRELFFVMPVESADGRPTSGDLYVVEFGEGAVGRPRLVAKQAWRTVTFRDPSGIAAFGYDITPDGERFVVIEREIAPEPGQINLLWGILRARR